MSAFSDAFFAVFRLSVLLCLGLLATGCAGTHTPDDQSASLPSVTLPEGHSVHVTVTGLEPPARDFSSLLSASLQSERGLRIAETAKEADATVRIHIRDIFIIDTTRRLASPGTAFGRGATGTLLGATIGSLVGGNEGALWGAAGGAVLGLGVAVGESGGTRNIWAMKADITISGTGSTSAPQEVIVRAPPADKREDALPALEDALAQTVVRAFRSSQ